jgi:hypothetical protein
MLCYRFPNRQKFRALAAAEGLIAIGYDGEERLITDSHTHSLVEIGAISKGGEYDSEGNVITPPTVLPGWHVNTLGLEPKAWKRFQVVVKTPSNTFFCSTT